MTSKRYRVSGVVEERETGRPLAGLIVRAFDKDVVLDDRLGFTTTDEEGRFAISFGEEAFRDLWEQRPDVYLRIYDPSGTWLVHETSDAVRWNASPDERFRIRVAGAMLLPPHLRRSNR